MSVISLDKIEKVYGTGQAKTTALSDITLNINAGEFVAIMGPSGSGKSTLMNVIGLLDSPSDGNYQFDGTDVSKYSDKQLARIRRRKIGFIFQNFNLLQRHTSIENVTLPMVYAHIERFRRERKAAELLERVGLEDRLYHFPNELSGGQMQRVAIARALANSPSIILADEPTGNLDTASGEKVMSILEELYGEGNTILMVTHDEKVARHAKRTIHMIDGRIDSDTSASDDTDKEKPKKVAKKKTKAKTKKKKDSKSKAKKGSKS